MLVIVLHKYFHYQIIIFRDVLLFNYMIIIFFTENYLIKTRLV